MNHQDRYLQANIMSASPGEHLIMLYDALLKHADKAEMGLAFPHNSPERIQAINSITRCIEILTRLNTNLRHEIQPRLCKVLSSLYLFFVKEMSRAQNQNQPGKIRAIIPLIQKLSDAWKQAHKLASQPQDQAA